MARGTVSVLVLPFEVHGPGSLVSLREQIQRLVSQQLADEGVTVLDPQAPDEVGLEKRKRLGLRYFRDLGSDAAADFVIWGSLTQIGRRFSLDARVVESYGETPPEVLYVEGAGVESMLDSVRKLARDIGMRVLRLDKVSEVVITGNKRIESEAVKRIIKTKSGDLYLTKHIQDDVKSIHKMGYFGDVRVNVDSSPDGKVVTFSVEERETIRHIRVRGNRKFDDEEVKEILHTRSGAILNVNTLRSDLKEIRSQYKEEGYHNAEVTYEIKPVLESQADVEYVIEEGEKVFVKSISFEGNTSYDDDKLKKLMKTKEKGFFSWLTSSGDLDLEALEQDMAGIAAFYHNHGYIQAKVGEPELSDDENSIYISVKIEEGAQFKVGKVSIEGDLIQPEEELLEKIKISQQEVFNREVIREDILALGDIYSDEGYAYAEVSPRIDQRVQEHEADITYVIGKGQAVYFEKIIIAGNTKTRDKVIRRELRVYEQELFSGEGLRRGTRNLYRLDFFEDVKVNTMQGSSPDKMVLKIDVTEKPTGAFSFGGGYSSVDHMFAMASISQKNLFGRGQVLMLKATLGSRTSNYTFSFTEPWLFDIPLSAGIDLYNANKDYDTYDKDSVGGTLRASYPVFDYTRAFFSYNYDRAEIENLTSDASSAIREFAGTSVGHTLTGTLGRDTRDRIFNPTKGSDNSLTIRHAGTPFGGDIGFTKYVGESGWFIPLFWKTVGFLHGRVGFINGDSAGKVPVWERFYLGGMNSIRGYNWREISPRDPVTNDKIGGNKMIQFNAEFLFPLIPKSGLRGVIFYDTGNVYDNGEKLELNDLRESAGCGIRWFSPIGPIRLEWGYILDAERRGEGGWEFSMGMAF
jgi:outer membrane protein insertion porin family